MNENIKIEVLLNNKTNIIDCKKGENLLQILSKNGYFITAFCGGKGTCGKCKVKLFTGKVEKAISDENGCILSCRALIVEPIKIEVFDVSGNGLTFSNLKIEEKDELIGYGIALDIGTTTLAFYLIDLKSGKEIENYSSLNPQAVFGGDVISRISAALKGNLFELHKLIINKTNKIINYFIEKYNIKEIEKMTVCGNTTMLHLFFNEDVSSLGFYPFTPVFIDTKIFEGKEKGLNVKTVIIMPSVSAYIGSDITAGVLAVSLKKGKGAKILLDIGTNGEIVLFNNNKLYSTSTAAGPAFEGANISCGMGGVAGAIDSVKIVDNNIKITTISGNAQGICGSGLIDAVSIMKDLSIFDETGAFINNDKYYLTKQIYISQKDIREFQLAKSAICSGLKVLIKYAGVNLRDIEKVYLAGGLGFYLNIKNAINIGLIPEELENKIVIVGNSAGMGAKSCLLSLKKLEECEKIAKETVNIDLSTDENFINEYMNNIYF